MRTLIGALHLGHCGVLASRRALGFSGDGTISPPWPSSSAEDIRRHQPAWSTSAQTHALIRRRFRERAAVRSLLPELARGRDTVHEKPLSRGGTTEGCGGLKRRQGSLATCGTGKPLRRLGKDPYRTSLLLWGFERHSKRVPRCPAALKRTSDVLAGSPPPSLGQHEVPGACRAYCKTSLASPLTSGESTGAFSPFGYLH